MLQQDTPEDYVIATGKQYAVRDFVNTAAKELKMEIVWQGSGIDEKGIDNTSGRPIIAVDPNYFRPTEVETLLGDPSKARLKLGWEPEISFDQLVREMVQADLIEAEKDHLCQTHGYNTYAYNE